jgi:hypothetical protein
MIQAYFDGLVSPSTLKLDVPDPFNQTIAIIFKV